jgi:hypothetical protein
MTLVYNEETEKDLKTTFEKGKSPYLTAFDLVHNYTAQNLREKLTLDQYVEECQFFGLRDHWQRNHGINPLHLSKERLKGYYEDSIRPSLVGATIADEEYKSHLF